MFETKKNGAKKLRNKSYSNVKEKNIFLKTNYKQTTLPKKLDTMEEPLNNHTIVDQDGSWTIPLNNCLGAMFVWGL